MLGLDRTKVKIVSYNPKWVVFFKAEQSRLRKGLPDVVKGIEHIGSTAVPGLAAKPLIDILIGSDRNRNMPKIQKYLEKLGYIYRGKDSTRFHHIYALGPESKRTHHVHVVTYGGVKWKRDLSFRDFLRGNKAEAKRYQNFKQKLASRYADNRPAYSKGKHKYIRSVISRIE